MFSRIRWLVVLALAPIAVGVTGYLALSEAPEPTPPPQVDALQVCLDSISGAQLLLDELQTAPEKQTRPLPELRNSLMQCRTLLANPEFECVLILLDNLRLVPEQKGQEPSEIGRQLIMCQGDFETTE